MPMARLPWSVVPCVGFLALVFGLRGGLPFVRFPAFAFPDTGGVQALPLFYADGVPADPSDYVDFAGVGPDAVDVEHPGLPSVVAHRFVEAQAWIAGHPGAGGPVEVQVGLRVLRRGADGRVRVEDRIDGRGTARRAP